MSRPFLLLGHHRSGTNFVNDLLQIHPDCECLNEPLSMHSTFWMQRDLIAWGEQDYDPDHMHRDLEGHPGAATYLADLHSYLHAAPTGRIRGAKETLLFEKLGWLHRFAPAFQVIILVRDPRAVASSIIGRNMQHLWAYDDRITPRIARTAAFAERSREDVLAQVVWSWKERLALALSQSALFDCHILRLEDLVAQPRSTLAGLMGFLGRDVDCAQMAFMQESRLELGATTYSWSRTEQAVLDGWKTRLSEGDVRFIERNVVGEMAQFGYVPRLAV
jgi:sulfotransferase family protein